MLVLDGDQVDDDTLFDAIDPLDLLLTRGRGLHIDAVIAAGRAVVQDAS